MGRATDRSGKTYRSNSAQNTCWQWLTLHSPEIWLALKRRNRIHVYPDDWKPLPVAKISIGDQTEIVRLVDAILAEFRVHGCPLPPNASAEVSKLEREIDARVARLCGLTEADVTAIERVEGGVTTLS